MVLNYRLIAKIMSAILVLIGASMIPSMAVSLLYGDTVSAAAFLKCMVPMILVGAVLMKKIRPWSRTLRMRDGFLTVALCWLLASLLGGLPFVLSGAIPSFVDAFFETASGFTTTGSSILTDIEVLPRGILFWRSFTHWLGGMGILVFFIALLPSLGIGGQNIVNAETTGPIKDKLTAKISDSAKLLYTIYIGMTVIEVVLLCLGGMSLYDSLVHTFGTVGTGGLSVYNSSIGHYGSAYIHVVIAVFMMLAGINFNLYYHLISGNPREFFSDYELRGYIAILGIATGLIAIDLVRSGIYDGAGEALRYSFFQSSSIITTTGYSTTNFDLWPTFSKMVLFILMFVGGCSSSTGGGVKVIRVLLLFKLVRRGLYRRLHPRAVVPLKLGGRALPSEVMSGVSSFIFLYIGLLFAGTLLLSFEGFDLVSTFTAVLASIGNIGPGFELVGPSMNYSIFSAPAKILLSIYMIIGRLELFTIILLATPTFWNPDRR
ncbi:TrkH family potassium uptake protein [Bacilliculturomica massiliensis]|uniref:TrkH family potassium uptake protein n=1 Tax=Bacilliculturomica massiliensis TaxID=1917867 RepID=UPI001FE81ABF|nr:TrkH family potassium uptake protein [Bacilliculturomica massiliensis]